LVNRNLWDSYAETWSKDADHIKKMTFDVKKQVVQVLGEEWSDKTSFQDVVKEMIVPYC